ncbi:MAG: hypothetical protein M1826_005423 [Phylliscum demangeonii]|nr:MAG: hypothetical protein M1826_005423 [Phylliscum demangeonii]
MDAPGSGKLTLPPPATEAQSFQPLDGSSRWPRAKTLVTPVVIRPLSSASGASPAISAPLVSSPISSTPPVLPPIRRVASQLKQREGDKRAADLTRVGISRKPASPLEKNESQHFVPRRELDTVPEMERASAQQVIRPGIAVPSQWGCGETTAATIRSSSMSDTRLAVRQTSASASCYEMSTLSASADIKSSQDAKTIDTVFSPVTLQADSGKVMAARTSGRPGGVREGLNPEQKALPASFAPRSLPRKDSSEPFSSKPRKTATATPSHASFKLGRGKLQLFNPMSLFARHRSTEATSRRPASNIPPMMLPDNYDPRIRGEGVHDFSAPRLRSPGLQHPRRFSSMHSCPYDSLPSTSAGVESGEPGRLLAVRRFEPAGQEPASEPTIATALAAKSTDYSSIHALLEDYGPTEDGAEEEYDGLANDEATYEEAIPGVNVDTTEVEDKMLELAQAAPSLSFSSADVGKNAVTHGANATEAECLQPRGHRIEIGSPSITGARESEVACGVPGICSADEEDTRRESSLSLPTSTTDASSKSISSNSRSSRTPSHYDEDLFDEGQEQTLKAWRRSSSFRSKDKSYRTSAQSAKSLANLNEVPSIIETVDASTDLLPISPERGTAGVETEASKSAGWIAGIGSDFMIDASALRPLSDDHFAAYYGSLAVAANVVSAGRAGTGPSDEPILHQPSSTELAVGISEDFGGERSRASEVGEPLDGEDADLEDDSMITAANAEALASDADGFYGQEFDFYAGSSGTSLDAYAHGGFFGPDPDDAALCFASHSGNAAFREPNLTPITERSEYSARSSFVLPHPHHPAPGGSQSLLSSSASFSSASSLVPGPGLAQLAALMTTQLPVFDDEDISLASLRKLRRHAWGGSDASDGSLHGSESPSAGGSPPLRHLTLPVVLTAEAEHEAPGAGDPTSFPRPATAESATTPPPPPERDHPAPDSRRPTTAPAGTFPATTTMTMKSVLSPPPLPPPAPPPVRYVHEENSWILERLRRSTSGRHVEVLGREPVAGGRI